MPTPPLSGVSDFRTLPAELHDKQSTVFSVIADLDHNCNDNGLRELGPTSYEAGLQLYVLPEVFILAFQNDYLLAQRMHYPSCSSFRILSQYFYSLAGIYLSNFPDRNSVIISQRFNLSAGGITCRTF